MRCLLVIALLLATCACAAQTVEYVHTDSLGSPVAITNQAGQVIERMQYEPFGALTNNANGDRPGYTGHVMDSLTLLTYMQQRYYDPTIGRFVSTDPVQANANTGASFNRFWYANNNPYLFTDPDGRQACPICRDAANRARSAGTKFLLRKSSEAVQNIADNARQYTNDKITAARDFVSQRDVVVSLGLTGMAGATLFGTSPAAPAIQLLGSVSILANLSSGQVGLQASAGPLAGVGGGAMIAPEVSVGLSKGVLETGVSKSNTAYAQFSAAPATGAPIDMGGSVNWSSDGSSVSTGLRGGAGTYIGAGRGQIMSATLVTPPLREHDKEE